MKTFLPSLFVVFLLINISCKKDYVPKPRGYFRIGFQEKVYHEIDSAGLNFKFEIPVYSKLIPDADRLAESGWVNITFPKHKAELHLSYKNVKADLFELTEDAHTLAYSHTIKADAIDEQPFISKENKVYGTIYTIEGNAASPFQFYLTDSTHHFLRGALYIREVPNIDSIKPVIVFLETDLMRLIETTQWKN
jgi:gliding motility-associated lipoprotein GldD